MIYEGDSDDVYPVGVGWDDKSGNGGWASTYGGWARDTAPYIKSIGLLRDGSDSLALPTGAPTWLQDNVKNNYTQMISMVANGYSDWCPQLSKNELMGVMGYGTTQQLGASRTSVSATSVNQIADTIMLAERFGSNNDWGPEAILTGVNWQDGYFPSAQLIPDGSRDGTPYNKGGMGARLIDKDNRFGAVSHAYGNQSVFTFTDGHAKSMDPRATNPSTYGQLDKNMWNSLR